MTEQTPLLFRIAVTTQEDGLETARIFLAPPSVTLSIQAGKEKTEVEILTLLEHDEDTILIHRESVDKKSRKQGQYFEAYADGTAKTIGTFTDNKPSGEWLSYHSNALKKSQGFYDEKGKKTGTWITWYANGQEATLGPYTSGKKTGAWKTRYENGNLASDGNYKEDKKSGDWKTYHKNGTLESAGPYVDHKKHGAWVTFRKDGSKETVGFYENDKKEGPWEEHPPKGPPSTGTFTDDKKTGIWHGYHALEEHELFSFYGQDGKFLEGARTLKHLNEKLAKLIDTKGATRLPAGITITPYHLR